MGFCNRCGEISSSGKCRRCGGRSVASIATGLGSDTVSIVDKWQTQYANSILGHDETIGKTTSTPLIKRNSTSSVLNRPSSLLLPKACAQCNERFQYDTPTYLQNDLYYCKSCHEKTFNLGNCTACTKIISQQDSYIEHSQQVWHDECFSCHGCHILLKDAPMVDLKGRPCCEPCLMSQAGKPHNEAAIVHAPKAPRIHSPPPSTISTPVLSPSSRAAHNLSPTSTLSSTTFSLRGGFDTLSSMSSLSSTSSTWLPRAARSSRPRIDSHLFHHYQKSLQNNATSESMGATPTETEKPRIRTPPLSSPSSPMSDEDSARSVHTPSPVAPLPEAIKKNTSTPLLSRPHRSRSSSVSLNDDLGSLRLSSSPTLPNISEEHRSSASTPSRPSRSCRQCQKPLSGPRVKLPTPTGDVWYHYDCLTCDACHLHFTESEFVSDGKGIYHTKCKPVAKPKEKSSSPSYQCHTCSKPITEKCLKNGNQLFHPQCFLCAECHIVLPYDQPFYEVNNAAHCEACSRQKMTTVQHKQPSPPEESPEVKSRESDHPSRILSHRTRALPKLGGSKICPRCRDSIAVMDDTPGPRASRWHKKCLRCAGCSKQMDSGAKVTEGENGEWLVYCRNCACFDKMYGRNAKLVR
ncbi:uncharacterized protein BYT42DRAFT_586067 [Radiomyces spectabilis]|uniref:uncharacterized protein n=1 Tax=Radiomyces spectabilis TaxID=64574 RepID=UPI0022209C00|nr:uncharacterized protein BYT42DRAFT_586067 [Radiomyces spectabilis]KAI8368297.1 hypothetical protein BYT42DRAFT_586067 [Radiomyces spectabilis]